MIMGIKAAIFQYLSDQWGTRTKIVLPNFNSEKITGSFTDTETVIHIDILDVGTDTKSMPISQASTSIVYGILNIRIISEKNKGYGLTSGHIDQLETIFKNNSVDQDGYLINFREPRERQPHQDISFNIIPWECSFFVIRD